MSNIRTATLIDRKPGEHVKQMRVSFLVDMDTRREQFDRDRFDNQAVIIASMWHALGGPTRAVETEEID
jgi:hypothetical protein